MFLLFFLTLLIGSVALLSWQLILFDHPVTIVLGIRQPLVFLVALIAVIRSFRDRGAHQRQIGLYVGTMVAACVPALGNFLFGLLYLASGLMIFTYIGWGVALAMLIAVLVGIFWGRWNWQVRSLDLAFDSLPAALDGTKIVQISDVHVGSFLDNHRKVEQAIDLINSLEPDYVLFTGDLVNNKVDEMNGWEPVFSRIQAKKGKYSILGNHDYGDYIRWNNEQTKQANLEALIDMHRKIGFTPLLNENVQLSAEENGAYLIGVENWGAPPFRQSGNLEKATAGIPENAFRLLLSHDPSHFDLQVLGTGIDLTLSGHTHGFQFGIERFGIRFSPVQFRYKKWAGLYTVGNQHLYVNRGFGYLVFPGRVGIYPEITSITLHKNA